jgi:hypothetical protein
MAIAIIATQSTAFGSGGGTTVTLNTTGANLIIVPMTYIRTSTPTLSDSFGNVYSQLTKYEDPNSNGSCVVWYTVGTAGSGHTWTTNCRLGVTSIIAVSGARTVTTPFDLVAGSYSAAMPVIPSPWSAGTLTPSVDNCILVTCVCQNAAVGAPGVPSGYTLVGSFGVGTSFPGAAAYKIQTTASLENPGWVINTGGNVTSTVADFMPPAVPVVYNPNYNFFIFFGN